MHVHTVMLRYVFNKIFVKQDDVKDVKRWLWQTGSNPSKSNSIQTAKVFGVVEWYVCDFQSSHIDSSIDDPLVFLKQI